MSYPLLSEIFKFACFGMTGVIWIIQWVHYPSFHFIDEIKSLDFHKFHQKAITWVVLPLMVGELFIGGYLAYQLGWTPFWSFQLAGILLIWAITFFVSVPLHEKLVNSNSLQVEVIDQLVRTNWLRTFLWSLRSLGLLIYL